MFIDAFCYSKIHLHLLGNLHMFCKVYLQYGIIIQRAVTIHGLLSIQKSCMMNLKIELAKIECLSTIWST